MALYIRVVNGVPDPETKQQRPNWRDSNGDPVSDTFLRDNAGLYRYIDEPPPFRAETETRQRRDPSAWTVDDSNVTVTVGYDIVHLALDEAVDRSRGRAAAVRYEHEAGGMSFTRDNGETVPLSTSRDGQAALTAEKDAVLQGDRTDGAGWKLKNGNFVPFDNAEIERAWKEVRQMIQASFERERTIVSNLANAADIAEVESILDNDMQTGWPDNALREVA